MPEVFEEQQRLLVKCGGIWAHNLRDAVRHPIGWWCSRCQLDLFEGLGVNSHVGVVALRETLELTAAPATSGRETDDQARQLTALVPGLAVSLVTLSPATGNLVLDWHGSERQSILPDRCRSCRR